MEIDEYCSSIGDATSQEQMEAQLAPGLHKRFQRVERIARLRRCGRHTLVIIHDQIPLLPCPGTRFTRLLSVGPLSTETTPSPVSLSATLLCPFSSWADAKQAGQQKLPDVSIPVVVSMPPIQTNDWTNKTYTSIMKIPPGLAPGFYVEIERDESVSSIGTGDNAGACVLKFIS